MVCAAHFSALIPLFWLLALSVASLAAYMGFHSRWRWLLLFIAAIAAGGWRYSFLSTDSPLTQFHDVGGATITGIIIEEPDRRDADTRLIVSAEIIQFGAEPVPTAGLVLVEVPANTPVRYGDRIRVTGIINPPQVFDTFSYADYLARQSVFSIMRKTSIERLSSGHGFAPYAALIDFREQLAQQIGIYLPEPQAGLLTGILLGQERTIAPEVADAFARTGTAHVIAISGFNMVVISGILMSAVNRMVSNRKLAAALGIGALALYTALVGANAAVVRAAIMSSLVIYGAALNRRSYAPASVAFTVLAFSLWHPPVLWDISFQLSIAAVLGITALTAPINHHIERATSRLASSTSGRFFSNLLRESISMTLAATIATAPLIALYFQRLSLISLPINLLILPVQPLILFLGGLATISTLIVPVVAQLLYWFALIPLAWTTSVVRAFAPLSFSEVQTTVPASLIFAFYLLFVGGIMVAARPYWLERWSQHIRRRTIVLTSLTAGLCLAGLLIAILLARPDGMLHVWWLNVGQSNAILIQTPAGAQMLVDGGRYPSRLLTALGDRIPFHDRELETVIITQPDESDIQALPAVLARYQTGIVLTNGQPGLSDTYLTLEQALANREVLAVRAGYTITSSDGVTISILSPQMQPDLGDSLNDHALVLRIQYGKAVMLLPGDLSTDTQDALVESGIDLQASVLQIPRHATIASLSEKFLQAVRPQLTIIQTDQVNDPALDTVSMLSASRTFRTDKNGALHLWTDGSALWVLPEIAD
jgi:competence protein ComEC